MIPFINTKCLLILTISLFILTAQESQLCKLTTDEINKQIFNATPIPCLQKALRNGWQKVIDYLVRQKQAQYKEEFIHSFQQQLKRLKILQEEIVLGTSETEPIFKWGQNRTHVFITFKLSHRWDSPPCLYTQSEQSRLEQETFSYNNICLVSHQKVTFKVNLNLNKKVFLSMKNNKIYDQSKEIQGVSQQTKNGQDLTQERNQILTNFTEYSFQVKKDGVGQYSTILLKRIPEIWIFLTKQEKLYPIWHEISQRYPDDFNQYEQKVQAHKILQRQRQAVSRQSGNTSQSQL